ncbi:MAG: RsmD family RNA methyltransferase [Proteobacteria bacterium]|nr:RsmD family RNA methyltransferase [Pseudomonadota bacterium]
MRIVSGMYKNTVLRRPSDTQVRPTPSIMRGSVVSYLKDSIPGAVVWDMFSGTGIMGMEFASAGAAKVLFFDNHPMALSILKDNIRLIKSRRLPGSTLPPRLAVINKDLFTRMDNMDPTLADAQIFWADPPYPLSMKWLQLIVSTPISFLKEHGWFLMKVDTRELDDASSTVVHSEILRLIKTKTYGNTSLIIAQVTGRLHQVLAG